MSNEEFELVRADLGRTPVGDNRSGNRLLPAIGFRSDHFTRSTQCPRVPIAPVCVEQFCDGAPRPEPNIAGHGRQNFLDPGP